VRDLFNRVFQTALKPLLAQPDRVKARIDSGKYFTQLFFSDPSEQSLTAMFSADQKPFTYHDMKQALRVHFIHTNGSQHLRQQLMLKILAHATEKEARALLFFTTPAARELTRFLNDCNFEQHSEKEGYTVMVHRDLSKLQKTIEAKKTHAPPPPVREKRDELAPTRWKSCTLMKKYLLMIRRGQKPVEGRINRGMFSARGLEPGMGMRFFYQQNPNDDVQCLVEEFKTFSTFRDMLEHYGWKNCVPDARSLDHAVEIYARIPGYASKERESGVIGIKLKVLGSGLSGPYHKSTPQLPRDQHTHKRQMYQRSTYDQWRSDEHPAKRSAQESTPYRRGRDDYRR